MCPQAHLLSVTAHRTLSKEKKGDARTCFPLMASRPALEKVLLACPCYAAKGVIWLFVL